MPYMKSQLFKHTRHARTRATLRQQQQVTIQQKVSMALMWQIARDVVHTATSCAVANGN